MVPIQFVRNRQFSDFFNSTRESLDTLVATVGRGPGALSLLTSPQPNGESRPSIFVLVLLGTFDFIVAGLSLDVLQAGLPACR